MRWDSEITLKNEDASEFAPTLGSRLDFAMGCGMWFRLILGRC